MFNNTGILTKGFKPMTKKHLEYTDDHIDSLSDVEAFRLRPTVYIGDIGLHGVMHLFKEIVTNSIDEHLSGFGNIVEIYINFDDKRGPKFTIVDSGRGIPLGKLHDSVSKKNTSGKYGDIGSKKSGGYGQSAGLNGLGQKATNAISRDFTASSCRDGERWTVFFDKGHEIFPIKKEKYDGPSGTVVSFIPDVEVLKDVDISSRKSEYISYIEITSYINPGLTLVLHWGKDKPVKFCHPNGMRDYFNKIMSEKKIHIIGQPNNVVFNSADGEVGYNIIYAFADRNGGSTVSYVNGIPTIDGGNHVSTLTEAFGVLTSALNKGNFIPKAIANSVKITGNEIRDTLFAIILANKMNPKFDTQIKSRFTSEDYKPLVINQLKNQISEWIVKNPDTIDKIGKHCALLAKVKYENQKNKDKILKSGSNSKTDLFKSIDTKKFSDCNKNDSDRSELFLCEGDSAAGQVITTRDRDYQAVFALRGKVKNVVKAGDDLSEELVTLAKIMGCGFGADKDIRKLRYRRIIILTDADVDGFHISSLLIAFFFTHYRELIENGNIFIAKSPLYTIKSPKNPNIYINSHDQLATILNERSIRIFNIIDKDDRKLPIGVAKHYMANLPDYADMLDTFGSQLSVDPLLLEAIAMNFKEVMKGNLKPLRVYGFEDSGFDILPNGNRIINVDIGYKHYYLQIDKTLMNKVIKPITDFILKKIKLCRIRLVGKATGLRYSEFYYEQGKLIYNTLFGNGNGIEIKRAKGLGANSPEELRETSLDPKTRYLIELKITDRKDTDKWITDLFTNSDAKREMFMLHNN